MTGKKLKSSLFVTAACALSLPWLTPCAYIAGAVVAGVVVDTVDELSPRSHDYDFLPRNLRELAVRPGPRLAVQKGRVSRRELVDAAEFEAADGRAGQASRPFTFASSKELRQRLVLCEQPFVLLYGNSVTYIKAPKVGGQEPSLLMACASQVAKAAVITPEGTFIALAHKIHFRAPSSEIVLEGNPTVQSGSQLIKPVNAAALMRLDFARRIVTCDGPFIEKKF